MIVPSHAQLIASIDAFLNRHPEIGEAKFGRSATGEPGLLQRLRAGSSPTLRVMTKISEFMAAADGSIEVSDVVHNEMDTVQ